MQELHVSPNGNDRNPGTLDAPLKTLTAAKDHIRELIRSAAMDCQKDITVHLAPGVHRLTETLILGREDGGDGSFNVTWKGSADGKTQISSGIPLDGWQRCDEALPDLCDSARGNVWYIDLPKGMKVNTLYGPTGSVPRARGEAIQPRKLPVAEQAASQYGPDGPIRQPRQDANGMAWFHDRFGFSQDAIKPASDLDQAEFLIIPVNQWTMNILPVGRIDFESGIVHLGQNCTYPIGVPHCAPDGSIWLENSLSVIAPGTWVYHAKQSRLYYCPAEDVPEPGLEAAGLVEFIRMDGSCHDQNAPQPVMGIHFRDLVFTRSNRFAFHGLTGRGIQHDWEMHDAPSCMVRLRNAQQCSVVNCHFLDGGSGGVRMDLACRGNRVEACEFERLGGCGVVLCGYGLSRNYLNRENQVVDCHFHHLGLHYWHCPGIFIWQSGDNHIVHNHLHDLPYTGIVCSGRTVLDRKGVGECSATIHWDDVEAQCGKGYKHMPWHSGGLVNWWMREPLMHSRDNLIEYNRIHDVMQIMGDGNGIYVSGAGGGNVVRFNVVGPCPSPTMAEGIRCDDDQHQTIIHGNLIYAQAGHATGITLKGINRVTNNILALPLNATTRGMLSLETGPLNGTVIRRNIIYTSATDQHFVSEMRIHGEGRKARLRDTDSDENIYFCTSAPEAGQTWLEEQQDYGIDGGSLCCDPGFVDAENGDFSLKENAAALKLGFRPLPLGKMLD
jgi:hypothetical protein